MAAFGIDPALLEVDETELARLKASIPVPDLGTRATLDAYLGKAGEPPGQRGALDRSVAASCRAARRPQNLLLFRLFQAENHYSHAGDPIS
jgi:hypothetical protein